MGRVEAYTALLSLTHVLDNVHNTNPHYFLSCVDGDVIKSLCEAVGFLLDFVEACHSQQHDVINEALESRIIDAAYEAEDVIEDHVVGQASPKNNQQNRILDNLAAGNQKEQILNQRIKEVTRRMDSIKKEASKIQQQPSRIEIHQSAPPLPPTDSMMVGFDDVLIQILDRLTGQGSNLQVIPISGMGGIGKTTLASTVYSHRLALHRFDIRAWVTVSQEYSVHDILYSIANQIGALQSAETVNTIEDHVLRLKIHQTLFGRRYLIVVDDIWDIAAFEAVSSSLPDNNDGSRIVITTRLSNVADRFGSDCGVEMSFLDEDQSWNLFSQKVFGGKNCPIEFEEVGKKIVRSCRGLPLSISVVGGFLAKSEDESLRFWENVAHSVNSIITSVDEEQRCTKILSLSYSHLPIHVKPCFLYLGVYPEDYVFRVAELVKIWVAEGILRPNKAKSLEQVGEECIQDLLDRNLILLREAEYPYTAGGMVEAFSIHDMLRELCLKQAQEENFLYIAGKDGFSSMCKNSPRTCRRLCIPKSARIMMNQVGGSAIPFVRSFVCENIRTYAFDPLPKSVTVRRQRLWNGIDSWIHLDNEAMTLLVNSRHVFCYVRDVKLLWFMHSFWNLQTLKITRIKRGDELDAPNEIWEMRQLRHLEISYGFYLPCPPPTKTNKNPVLENLQTLLTVLNFRFPEELVKRIPNVKTLGFVYLNYGNEEWSAFRLKHLSSLKKLESLSIDFFARGFEVHLGRDLAFPCSLKRLTLESCEFPWEDMRIVASSLPNLEILELFRAAFRGYEWIANEGDFRFLRLKVLHMENLNLKFWSVDSTNFPCLQHLSLKWMDNVVEIPLDFAYITTLRSIKLVHCNESTIVSAEKIREESQSLGDESSFQVETKRPPSSET